jgi:hypothetical protein
MDPLEFGGGDATDRQCRFVTVASWCLAWLDQYALWPLQLEERKEFRKTLLLKVSAVVDEALRSDTFVWLLGRLLEAGSDGVRPERGRSEPRLSVAGKHQANEPVKEALREISRLLGEENGSGHHGRIPARSVNASPHGADQRNGVEAGRGGVPEKASDDEEAGRRLLEEMRQTNRQISELLALQRAMLERIGERAERPEESRHVADRPGKNVP